jgi:predicted RNA-binding protein with PIN domain
MSVTRRVVDGMNVIGSRPDGWWRDRDGAALRLLGRLGRMAARGEPVTLVLDGRPIPGLPEGEHEGVEVLYARRAGRDAGDDRIVELVREAPDALCVVTSDRALRQRVQALGASVEGASTLLDRLDRLDLG